MKYLKTTTGFTLIELLVVTTIIVVLTTIGIVSYASAGKNARDAKRKSDIETIRQALVLYRSDNGCYPNGSISDIASILISGDYISSPFPSDPKDPSQVYTYSPSGSASCSFGTAAAAFNLSATLEGDGTTYTVSNP